MRGVHFSFLQALCAPVKPRLLWDPLNLNRIHCLGCPGGHPSESQCSATLPRKLRRWANPWTPRGCASSAHPRVHGRAGAPGSPLGPPPQLGPLLPPAAPPSAPDPQPGRRARSHPRLRGLADRTDRPGALGMLSRGAPGSRVGSQCSAEPAGAHRERAALAAAAAAGPWRIRAGTRGESHAASSSCWQRRSLQKGRETQGLPARLASAGR